MHRRSCRIILGLLLVGVVTTASCTTTTPYKPYGMIVHEGYRDQKIGDKQFYIQYDANPYTPIDLVQEYWHRRAEELCGSDDYTYDTKSSLHPGAISRNKDATFPHVSGTATCK